MADLNLDGLSLDALKTLQKDVAKAIANYEDRKKAAARTEVEEVARKLGYSLADLAGTEKKPGRSVAPPKYRHPENPALTWSGRGRKPRWFVEAIDAGKSAEDMAI